MEIVKTKERMERDGGGYRQRKVGEESETVRGGSEEGKKGRGTRDSE